MKRWDIKKFQISNFKFQTEEIIDILLENRGFTSKDEKLKFLHPPNPSTLKPSDVGIDEKTVHQAITRLEKAIKNKEMIVVYADYDADGITAGTIMWETLFSLGAEVKPYIPHRVEEGYGFSLKGIDAIYEEYHPKLIISVDHGVTAHEKIAYAKSLGIDVIVTDHHVKPDTLPDCTIVHTTLLCGAGISWFVSKELLKSYQPNPPILDEDELLALAAIGTIADMVPLTHASRSIAKYGLIALNKTKRAGLIALLKESAVNLGNISTYDVSHRIAPRLNAMGRLVHALDALRLLCTKNQARANTLAKVLNQTNSDRQMMTEKETLHAKELVAEVNGESAKKLLFISHESYTQGVIGLIAGKLVERYYRPAIVISRGEMISKASARSIPGFNIIEAIRSASDLLIDAGGHPMAAGFTIETGKLVLLEERLLQRAELQLTQELLIRLLTIDMVLTLDQITLSLWESLQTLAPFGIGNPEPVFTSSNIRIAESRAIGRDGKHLKLTLSDEDDHFFEAVGFGMGELIDEVSFGTRVDVAYVIDLNEWNGKKKLQLKLKDIHINH